MKGLVELNENELRSVKGGTVCVPELLAGIFTIVTSVLPGLKPLFGRILMVFV
ncbi:MAG: hypothetical protein LBT59_03140 [Clostridiales bacterium]|jgi:hypothetical protein|nr:hypothetical protein [Clostridiales bacterium]